MATRRTTAPRKRPAPAASVRPAAPVAGNAEAAAEQAMAFDPQEAARQLMDQLDEVLRSEPSIDAEDRAEFAEHFAAALRDVVDSGSYADMPSEAAWQDAVDGLRQQIDQADTDGAGLMRQLASAIAPLERRETKIAMEFSRRMATDGQEAALAWLQAQSEKDAEHKAQESEPVPEPNRPTLRNETVQSRSRRLRGPPSR